MVEMVINHLNHEILCLQSSKPPFFTLNPSFQMISWNDFAKVDMRIGTIIDAQPFPKARKPAYQLVIDFGGEIGHKKSSAQITKRYTAENLIGKQIIAVVNFPPKQIANFMSECLVLGALGDDLSDVVLLQPQQETPNGWKVS